MRERFPEQTKGVLYLAEGGQETEVMYRHGFDLPEFAMFTLLEDPDGRRTVEAMYSAYLDVAARHGFAALVGGVDYRASPDWAGKLGYSPAELEDVQLRCIDLLRDVSAPFESRLPAVMIAGIVGPRGDAYEVNMTMSADQAAEYHAVQMGTLAKAEVDLVEAMTFNNVDEAIGVAQAAADADLPLAILFTLDGQARLASGPTLREAIEAIDDATGEDRPDFYGINCSHPEEFMPALEPGDWTARIRILRPNAALMDKISLCSLDHLEEGDPVDLGARMGALAARFPHIDIWGGCCGTWDKHLDQIAGQVQQ